MEFLVWLDGSLLADWVRTVGWVYPWVISFHSIGMGFLVGIIFMIILRVFGFGRYDIAALERFLLIVRIAFVVNLATGIVLFTADAQRFFFSPTFRIKLLLIVFGGVTGLVLSRMVFREAAVWTETGNAPLAAKTVAGVSLICWTGAILAGRLTAYLP